MKLFTTNIPASKINMQLVNAYLCGKVDNEFTLLKTPDDKIAISVNSDEDATFFQLKDMEKTLGDVILQSKTLVAGADDIDSLLKSVDPFADLMKMVDQEEIQYWDTSNYQWNTNYIYKKNK